MKEKLFLTIGFSLIICTGLAQDIQYSQYYANPLYLNPAFAGASPAHRLVLNHRIQWPNLPKAFSNSSLSYDANVKGLNSGFGVLINADKAGSANLRSTALSFNYSYNVSFKNKWVFKPGIAFGIVSRDIDYQNLLFGDQIDFNISGAPSMDPDATLIQGSSYLDFGAGGLLYNKQYWIGASVFHLNQPNNSLLNEETILERRITVHAGARFRLDNPVFRLKNRGSRYPTAAPGFVYKRQGEFQQLDVGSSFSYQPFTIGLWYRGLPFFKTLPTQTSHDALVIVFDLEYENFQFGYSFDMTISGLGANTGGAHEFSLQYIFELKRSPKKVTKKQKLLQCPAFLNRTYN